MLFSDKKQAARRALVGALVGVAAHVLLGYVLGWFSLIGPPHFSGFVFPACNFPYEIEWLGVTLSFALFALFGAVLGVSTLPFADGGKALLMRTLIHFALTASILSLWVGLNFRLVELPTFLVPLVLVYLLVWLGRWVGWYVEVAAIREKLGLAPAPSILKWRETLPYLPFALLLCFLLPAVLHIFDPIDVPVLTALLMPFLLLPIGGFCSALSLGKRQGFCPLYPLVCGLLYLPTTLVANGSAPFHCAIVLVAALAGNLLGAAWRKRERSH